MSEKLPNSLSDENPDLRKHIGCMNGLIKVFYRQHFPSRSYKNLPPGDELEREPSSGLQNSTERNSKKSAKEKQRDSPESSSSRAASFSSSTPRSSSFSSADVSITSQTFEPPAFSQKTFNENPVEESIKFQSNAFPQWSSHKSLDLREVIKDSINREAKELTVITTIKEDVYGNSPRPPLQQAKSARTLRASDRNSSGRSDGFLAAAPKDSPRLSYDERELRNRQKCGVKLKELPRLSLDSKERSMRNSAALTKSNSVKADMFEQQEPGSHRRTSSVVAKLMGLELPPDSTSAECNQNDQNKSVPTVDNESVPRSVTTTNENRRNLFCDSPSPFGREATSPRSKRTDLVKKSATSKFPMEPAPWKQQEGCKDQRSVTESHTKGPSSISVYGEIQKRLTQLEFKESGKDLRALKQILEAMEKTQQVLDSRKDDSLSSASVTNKRSALVERSNLPILESAMATKNFRSSIVLMKPAQVFEVVSPNDGFSGLHRIQVGNSTCSQKDTARKLTTMDLTPRPNHIKGHIHHTDKNTNVRSQRSKQNPEETHPVKAEISKSGKSQHTTTSPRSPQRKVGSEKFSHPSLPLLDTRTAQQRAGKQRETPSSRRKQGTKSLSLLQTNDRLSDSSHQSDARSLRVDSNISSTSNVDAEVIKKFRFEKISVSPEQHTPNREKTDLGYRSDRMIPEPVKITLEQPSPVSVLDGLIYGDDSPSPVRKISTPFKEDTPLGIEGAEWTNEDTDYLSSFSKLGLASETLDEFTINEAARPCDVRNIDHKYISEILLASGVLRDLEFSMTIVQLNQSRLPINPDLFFVLEQSQTCKDALQDIHRKKRISKVQPVENIRRKLLFDTINEVLAHKFLSEVSSMPCKRSSMLMDKSLMEHHLLETLCSEIDRLEANNSTCTFDDEEDLIWEDLRNQGMGWTTFYGEVPGMVLDIERLIFKDLINEVVTSEVKAIWGRPGGLHRQLFIN